MYGHSNVMLFKPLPLWRSFPDWNISRNPPPVIELAIRQIKDRGLFYLLLGKKKTGLKVHCRFNESIKLYKLLCVNFSALRMSLFWLTHQFEIRYNGRQLHYEICLSVQLISVFSVCHILSRKSRFTEICGCKRWLFSKLCTSFFPKQPAPPPPGQNVIMLVFKYYVTHSLIS